MVRICLMFFERVVRPGLFRIGGGDPEAAHEWTLRRLAGLSRWPTAVAALRCRYAVGAPHRVFGIEFPNRVGLAAGLDKDGVALPAWPALGFGFVEVGTVTWHPQPGNDRPRLFRLPASQAVINRMGFNNQGARALAARMTALGRLPVPVGISLGKSKVTPLAEAVADYRRSYEVLREHGDYFAVNVSSPNTPGLRRLQDRGLLDELLAALVGDRPILVKIAPDLTDHAIAELLEVCQQRGRGRHRHQHHAGAAGAGRLGATVGRAGRRAVRRAVDVAGPSGGAVRPPRDRGAAAGDRGGRGDERG